MCKEKGEVFVWVTSVARARRLDLEEPQPWAPARRPSPGPPRPLLSVIYQQHAGAGARAWWTRSAEGRGVLRATGPSSLTESSVDRLEPCPSPPCPTAALPPPPAALPSDGLLLELLGGPPSPRTCVASDACLSLGSQGSPSSPRSRDGDFSSPAAAADARAPPAGPANSTAANSPESTCQPAKQPILDLDPHRLAQRQKQIDFGKNTVGYQRYLQLVPRCVSVLWNVAMHI